MQLRTVRGPISTFIHHMKIVCFVCMQVCYLLKLVSLLFDTTLKAERKTLPTGKLMPISLTRVSVRSNYKVVYIVNTMRRAHDYHHYLYANRATTLRLTNAHIYCSQFQHPHFSPRTPLPPICSISFTYFSNRFSMHRAFAERRRSSGSIRFWGERFQFTF